MTQVLFRTGQTDLKVDQLSFLGVFVFKTPLLKENKLYSQLPLRRTPLGPAVSVHLREMSVL